MNTNAEKAEKPRLDVQGLLDVYMWVNKNLPEKFATEIELYLSQDLIIDHTEDVVDVYSALAKSPYLPFRLQAAFGLHNVMVVAPEQAKVLAEALLRDENDQVVGQTRETLGQMDELVEDAHERLESKRTG